MLGASCKCSDCMLLSDFNPIRKTTWMFITTNLGVDH